MSLRGEFERIRGRLGYRGRRPERVQELVAQGRWDEALAIYDELLVPSVVKDPVTDALLRIDRATVLAEAGRLEQALAGYDELIGRYPPEAPGPPELYIVAFAAAHDRASLLARLGQLHESLASGDELIARHVRDQWADTAELATSARLNRAVTLERLGLPEQALAGYDEVLTNPDALSQPDQLVTAGARKAALLSDLGRPNQALGAYDDVLARHGSSPAEHWLVTAVRVKRAELLAALARFDDALVSFDQLLADHRQALTSTSTSDGAPEQRVAVLEGMLGLGGLLEQLGRPEEAVVLYDEVAVNYTTDPADPVREQAVNALRRGSELLTRLGRHTDALHAYNRAEQLSRPS